LTLVERAAVGDVTRGVDVVFSTGHKSKGLEFDRVCLTDDYRETSGDAEERNIFYVASTRVKRRLVRGGTGAVYRYLIDRR